MLGLLRELGTVSTLEHPGLRFLEVGVPWSPIEDQLHLSIGTVFPQFSTFPLLFSSRFHSNS